MDPDANLREQLEQVERIASSEEHDDVGAYAARLADLVEALDAWIRNGGALPKAWQGKAVRP